MQSVDYLPPVKVLNVPSGQDSAAYVPVTQYLPEGQIYP